MSRRFYSEIHLHLIWHTRESRPLMDVNIEVALHRWLRNRIARFSGVFLHALNGTDNHIHLAVTVPPTLLVSDFVGDLKGSSSHAINQEFHRNGEHFAWQGGYGVVSFGTRDNPWVIAYIERQKEHHAAGSVHERLECSQSEE
jgi:putative transposase